MVRDSQRYILSIDILITTLTLLEETCVLHAWVSLSALEEPCMAELIVRNGILVSCLLRSDEGRLLFQDRSALSALQGCGEVEWGSNERPLRTSFSAQGTHTSSGLNLTPKQMTDGVELIPHRVREWSPVQLMTLSHHHRKVLVLADGSNTVQRIAELLHKEPQEVRQIISDLQKNHWIF